MPTITDQVRYSIIEQTALGAFPATSAWRIMRLNSESLSQTNNVVPSVELNAQRGEVDSIKSGSEGGGSIEAYVMANTVYEDLMASILGDDAFDGGGVAIPGSNRRLWAIEKKIPIPGGFNSYHRFVDCTASAVNISYSPNEPLTWNWDLVGGTRSLAQDGVSLDDADLVTIDGSSFDAPSPAVSSAPAMRAADVTVAWSLGDLNTTPTALSISIDSQNRGIQKIGADGNVDVALGKLAVRISFTALFQTNAPLIIMDAGTTVDLTVTMTDGTSTYELAFDRVKLDNAPVVLEGTGSDVAYQIEASSLVDAVGDQVRFDKVA